MFNVYSIDSMKNCCLYESSTVNEDAYKYLQMCEDLQNIVQKKVCMLKFVTCIIYKQLKDKKIAPSVTSVE